MPAICYPRLCASCLADEMAEDEYQAPDPELRDMNDDAEPDGDEVANARRTAS